MPRGRRQQNMATNSGDQNIGGTTSTTTGTKTRGRRGRTNTGAGASSAGGGVSATRGAGIGNVSKEEFYDHAMNRLGWTKASLTRGLRGRRGQ